MGDPELEVAINNLRIKCELVERSWVFNNGRFEAKYDVVSQGRLMYRKIAEIEVNNSKVKIKNLNVSMYGFQKDELMEKAAAITVKKLIQNIDVTTAKKLIQNSDCI